MGYTSKEEIREKYKNGNDLSKIKAIPADLEEDVFSNQNPQRVAVYCRVSTDGISQVTSFELQKKYYIKYVRNHPGWKLVGVYSDEGISATSIKNRIGLQMMLRDACEGKIDLIVIKSISRFCRNLGDSLRIIKELKSLPKPVGIFFETENMSTLDPTMDLIIKVLSMVAEEESKKKSEAITAACRQRFAEGFFNKQAILGYKRIGVNEIEVEENEAETVKLIYQMFLAGFSTEKIAETLNGLGRKKHTHIYLDGRIKEGRYDWNSENVYRVFDNEKRCGDVLAQKTYTYDCIEHIVKKNDKKVQMYYAVNQHTPIITREEFYLALKIREANKGGWAYGLYTIKTFVKGPLKGYVRTVPNWNGYGYTDYAKASLTAYGIEVNEDSIYPEYVVTSEENDMQDKESQNVPAMEHLYIVTDEEFTSELEYTEEERKILEEQRDSITQVIVKFREEKTLDKTVSNVVDNRFFSLKEKPILKIDSRGMFFNTICGDKIKEDRIIILYNPLFKKILVTKAEGQDEAGISATWKKEGKMRRICVQGLCAALYQGNDWNEKLQYRMPGRQIIINDKYYLEFDLTDPIIRVPENCVKANLSDEVQGQSAIDRILREVVSGKDYFSEIDDLREAELIKKVENRSRAVYFEEDSLVSGDKISMEDYKENKFSPLFIREMKAKGITPEEGWEYLADMAKFRKGYFDIFGSEWENRMCKQDIYPCSYDCEEAEEVRFLGWPSNYKFPTREDVKNTIDRISRRK